VRALQHQVALTRGKGQAIDRRRVDRTGPCAGVEGSVPGEQRPFRAADRNGEQQPATRPVEHQLALVPLGARREDLEAHQQRELIADPGVQPELQPAVVPAALQAEQRRHAALRLGRGEQLARGARRRGGACQGSGQEQSRGGPPHGRALGSNRSRPW